MKTTILSFFFSVFAFHLIAQNTESLSIGTNETIFSKVLNENRKIWVYAPENTSKMQNTNKKYPVIYLLDGDAHFYSTIGIVQQLSQANGNGVLPEMIIVGIENTNRIKDLVPSDDSNSFTEFIRTELLPFIDNKYNTAPYKILIGHSLGGLLVIDILSKNQDMFNAYIAIDPSFWYNDEVYLENIIKNIQEQNLNGRKLFIGIANTMPKDMTLAQLKSDKSEQTYHIRSIFKFDEFLTSKAKSLSYSHKYYEMERHNTVLLICEYDGLRFIFDYYFFDANEKDFDDSTALIASKLKIHYNKVSEEMGYKNTAPEAFINYLAYDALYKKHYDKSKALFELNIEWYPESVNVYNSFADYFVTISDTANAITQYKKALTIKKDSTISNKLNALTKSNVTTISINDLQKYAGTYTLIDFQLDIALIVRDGSLWAVVPGQAVDEFQKLSENIFTVKGKQGYTITFEMDGDTPKSFTSVQPNGTFKAVFKNK